MVAGLASVPDQIKSPLLPARRHGKLFRCMRARWSSSNSLVGWRKCRIAEHSRLSRALAHPDVRRLPLDRKIKTMRVIGFFVRLEHGLIVIACEGRSGYVVR